MESRSRSGSAPATRRPDPLLGHWSVWTRRVVELRERRHREPASPNLVRLRVGATDSDTAYLDAANGCSGCIVGLHEVLCG